MCLHTQWGTVISFMMSLKDTYCRLWIMCNCFVSFMFLLIIDLLIFLSIFNQMFDTGNIKKAFSIYSKVVIFAGIDTPSGVGTTHEIT